MAQAPSYAGFDNQYYAFHGPLKGKGEPRSRSTTGGGGKGGKGGKPRSASNKKHRAYVTCECGSWVFADRKKPTCDGCGEFYGSPSMDPSSDARSSDGTERAAQPDVAPSDPAMVLAALAAVHQLVGQPGLEHLAAAFAPVLATAAPVAVSAVVPKIAKMGETAQIVHQKAAAIERRQRELEKQDALILETAEKLESLHLKRQAAEAEMAKARSEHEEAIAAHRLASNASDKSDIVLAAMEVDFEPALLKEEISEAEALLGNGDDVDANDRLDEALVAMRRKNAAFTLVRNRRDGKGSGSGKGGTGGGSGVLRATKTSAAADAAAIKDAAKAAVATSLATASAASAAAAASASAGSATAATTSG
jgi:hypothetical protein